ncbi:uncharacterized protein LOC106476410 [Limulus polyphemus]|uniref:Uncharacterized protein LOC106476410 n=1 Tax=Limulus polyphemus TaxID=6850 RepID=A0ABM1C1C5_LIMPO|nr:uncharacterized protein LOC106476410 [Limulus polyphemus]
MIQRRVLLCLVFASCVVVFLVTYASDSFQKLTLSQTSFHWKLYDRVLYMVDTPGCQIPKWNIFDPTVKVFYQNVSSKSLCDGIPSFIEVKPNAQLEINDTILATYYVSSSVNISCSYLPIFRDPGGLNKRTDKKFKLGKPKNLVFGVPLQEEFIIVQCSHDGEMLHEEYISMTPLKRRVEERCAEQAKMFPKSENLNVMLIGIDSISTLNFFRHFEKTNNYLHKVLKAIQLMGYNKVGDNTFPNVTPFLTGHFIDYYWNETRKKMFFDHLDFVWKDYAKSGFRTMFAEDAPNIATFNYLKKGFLEPPTDYYYRPFALALEKSDIMKKSRTHCIQEKMEMQMVFDYVKQFTATMKDKMFLLFAFVARLTHDNLNYAGYADEPSFQLLKHLHETGALNNTMLIFFSDHGIRFGNIRKTYIGKFEERMPFLFIVLPTWFHTKYPDISRNLHTNQRRLTTPFDVHATLVHLLNLNEKKEEPFSTSRGTSLFTEISANRTCEDASILPHWCTCNKHQKVEVTDSTVHSAAKVLVTTVNHRLSSYVNVCVPLILDHVLDARLFVANEKLLKFQKNVNDVVNRHVKYGDKIEAPEDYLLTVVVSPSKAVFESTVRYDRKNEVFSVLDDVSRLNRYGNQSACIKNARLRKFCFCRR